MRESLSGDKSARKEKSKSNPDQAPRKEKSNEDKASSVVDGVTGVMHEVGLGSSDRDSREIN
jgi:hypothetical protein